MISNNKMIFGKISQLIYLNFNQLGVFYKSEILILF